MDPAKQQPKAAKAMQEGFAKGMTCIDCHTGIAHHLPHDPLDDDDDTDTAKPDAAKDAAAPAAAPKAEPVKEEKK